MSLQTRIAALITAIGSDIKALYAHAASTANPHAVTKAQVGLGSVDNTSDAEKNAAAATLHNKILVNPAVSGVLNADTAKLGSANLIGDWNDALATGAYMGANAANAPSAGVWYIGDVLMHNSDYVTQEVFNFTEEQPEKFRRQRVAGVWYPWVSQGRFTAEALTIRGALNAAAVRVEAPVYSEPSLDAYSPALLNLRSAWNIQLAVSMSSSPPYAVSMQTKHSHIDGMIIPLHINPLGGEVVVGSLLHVKGNVTVGVLDQPTEIRSQGTVGIKAGGGYLNANPNNGAEVDYQGCKYSWNIYNPNAQTEVWSMVAVQPSGTYVDNADLVLRGRFGERMRFKYLGGTSLAGDLSISGKLSVVPAVNNALAAVFSAPAESNTLPIVIKFGNAGPGEFFIGKDGAVGDAFGGSSPYAAHIYNGANTPLHFWTNANKVGTFDAAGNLLVGAASPGYQNANSMSLQSGSDGYSVYNHTSGMPSGSLYFAFGNGGNGIGSITQSGTTAVAYNTTSDHRLKNNVRPANAGRFEAIEFVDFEWVDGRHDCGVIAHQLQAIYPDLVVGEKDGTEIRSIEISPAIPAVTEQQLVSEAVLNDDGEEIEPAVYETVEITPAVEAVFEDQVFNKYQQVNYTGLIPRMGVHVQQLMKQVSAQQTLIDSLISRIEALENK